MFKIIMNNNIMDEFRIYGDALEKAKKIKKLFWQTTNVVIVEDSQGRILDRFN